MTYVDGMLVPVKSADRETYRVFAANMARVFKDHGAQSVVENWGVDVPEGKLNSMHTAVLLEPDETVVFSWITWPSKAIRDAAWEKLMADPNMPKDMSAAPFDGKRMIFGGFERIVES